jgi:hypothetical protein
MRPPSPKYQTKMDWRCGMSGRAPALPMRKPWVQTPLPPKPKTNKKTKSEDTEETIENGGKAAQM